MSRIMLPESMIRQFKENIWFPYYSAETRIGFFVQMFIDDLLAKEFSEGIRCVAPEFPLRHRGNNQADNLDFLCAGKDNELFFVELKTDSDSLKKDQAEKYLENWGKWEVCINGLKNIVLGARSDKCVKYFFLLEKLLEEGLVSLSGLPEKKREEISSFVHKHRSPATERGRKGQRTTRIRDFSKRIEESESEIKVVFLVPDKEKAKNILKRANEIILIEFSEVPDETRPDSGWDSQTQSFYGEFVGFLKSIER